MRMPNRRWIWAMGLAALPVSYGVSQDAVPLLPPLPLSLPALANPMAPPANPMPPATNPDPKAEPQKTAAPAPLPSVMGLGDGLNLSPAGCPPGPAGCSDGGCATEILICGPDNPVWFQAAPLLFFFQPQRAGFPLAVSAAPGQPNRTVLDGRDELGVVLGGSLEGGVWLNKTRTFGVGLSGFMTEHRSAFRTVSGGPGGLDIRRPFQDALDGSPLELFVATNTPVSSSIPAYTGTISTAVTARLAGASAHLWHNLSTSSTHQFDLFYGFRYSDLDESLTIDQRSNAQLIDGNGITDLGVSLRDRVYTRNQFYGGEIGGRLTVNRGIGFIRVTPKVGFGSTHQIIQVDGFTTGAATGNAGLLAAGLNADGTGNRGRTITNRFGLTTDINMQAGVQLSAGVRVAVGYQFLFLNNVARPASQLDPTINTRLIPVSPNFGSASGPPAPRLTLDREGFYAHGANIMLEVSY